MDPRALVRLGAEPLDEAELREFVTTPASGGIVVFSGNVRDHHQDRGVVRIDYAAVKPLARKKLEEICAEVLAENGIHRVAAVHRTGRVEVGEASVIVAASASHRDEAFRAARRLIDRIKAVLPVWKHEHFTDGSVEWAPGFSVPEEDRAAGRDATRSAAAAAAMRDAGAAGGSR